MEILLSWCLQGIYLETEKPWKTLVNTDNILTGIQTDYLLNRPTRVM
jgi:hypothetical protein